MTRAMHEASGLIFGCRCVVRGRRLSIVTSRRRLTATERASLQRDGYLLVPSLLDEGVLARTRHRLDELVRQTIAAWQAGPAQDIAEPGVVRVRLDLTDADFALCREHPLLGDAATAEPWQTLSAMWALTAFTAENGPLRVIPGSHRASEPPIDTQAFGSGTGPHPDEVKLTAPAGSVILFNNASLWHSGTFNSSPEPRLAVTAGFAPGRS
jgi:hypothetical protein